MRLLHVGSGVSELPAWFHGWERVRLDIDPRVEPDILADMADMGEIGQFDVVYSAHSLEHLFPGDVDKALQEFKRVLGKGGFVIILVPDLEGITVDDETLYDSPAGPITARDMIFGHPACTEETRFMSHRTGFTAKTMASVLKKAGFESMKIDRLQSYNLCVVAFPDKPSTERLVAIGALFEREMA